jgi:uncharacterized protein (UPF0332 family)
VSHAENKVKWCLNKAEKELKETGKHRGLVKIKPNIELARQHITKAEHNLKAVISFKKNGFSDWSASATFYSIYHGLLAILAKLGYESKNQECTFALIYSLIESKDINLDINIIKEINVLNHEERHENPTVIEVRESEQYGVEITLQNETYERLLSLAKNALDQIKNIIEE